MGKRKPLITDYTPGPDPERSDEKDAARYRKLRRVIEGALSGGLEVDDEKLCYEEPESGKRVRVYAYPDTPIGFYEWFGDDLDSAVDALPEGEA